MKEPLLYPRRKADTVTKKTKVLSLRIEKWEGTLSSGYHDGIQKEGAFILYFTATTCHLQ